MFKYIVKRLLISLLVLFGVSIIIYTLVRLMPNDYIDLKYASQIQQGQITQEDVDRFKELYGIGDKTFKGLVNGYVKWLGNVCRGNLGISFKYNKPVSTVIKNNMWISFAIAAIATILQFLIENKSLSSSWLTLSDLEDLAEDSTELRALIKNCK